MQTDLTYGIDIRGDHALFISEKHFIDDGWKLGNKVKSFLIDKEEDLIFFRVINSNGEEQHGHGWIKNLQVLQWG